MADPQVQILLVEDNPNDVELTLHAFKKHNLANHVHVARDGAEALEFLFGKNGEEQRDLATGPRLVLLDLKLPRVDGHQVLRRIKQDAETRKLPVVVMTASREEADLLESYEEGANGYIVKPVDFEKFTEAMRIVGLYWLLVNEPSR
jgi:two-component system, response regulator